jgi:hypothetical protein
MNVSFLQILVIFAFLSPLHSIKIKDEINELVTKKVYNYLILI